MGSEISREEIADAVREPRSECPCGKRQASMLVASASSWGETLSFLCTWCLLTDRHATRAIAAWNGRIWDQREVGDGFVAAFLDDLPAERPGIPVPAYADALDQFHRVTALYRHRHDLKGWAAWSCCALNPTVPERDVVAALEVIAAFDPSKVHWANAALVDWARLSAYAALDRERVVALHREHLTGEHADIYGRNAARALRRLGEDATWPSTPVDG